MIGRDPAGSPDLTPKDTATAATPEQGSYDVELVKLAQASRFYRMQTAKAWTARKARNALLTAIEARYGVEDGGSDGK